MGKAKKTYVTGKLYRGEPGEKKSKFQGQIGVWRHVANHDVFFPDKKKKKSKKGGFLSKIKRFIGMKEDVSGCEAGSLSEINMCLAAVIEELSSEG